MAALDWSTLGTRKFDLKPQGGVGQAATLGAGAVAAVPSGTFSALGGAGFPMQVGTSSGGLTAFGHVPISDGSTAVAGASMNSINVPATNPQSCTVAVLMEMTGNKADVTFTNTDGRQNAGLFSWESGGNSGGSVGIDRTVRFANGVGPGGGDWWLWNASALRVPCNLQLVVFRRNGGDVTINTSAADQQTITTGDGVGTSTQSFSAGTLQNNNTAIGKIARWYVWDSQLSDANVAALYNDVYASGGLAPTAYTGDVVLLGDSITTGRYGHGGKAWVDHFLIVAHAAKKRVWNYARSGEKLNGGLQTTLAAQIADTNSSTLTQTQLKALFGSTGASFPRKCTVVLMLGANDLIARGGGATGVTGAVMLIGLRAACQLLKQWGARVYVVAPTPVRVAAWASGTIESVETVRRDYITAAQALVGTEIDALLTWDGTDFEPAAATDAEIAKITTGPNYQLATAVTSNLMHTSAKGDGIHPGPIGHGALGGKITQFVMQRLIAADAVRKGGFIQRIGR